MAGNRRGRRDSSGTAGGADVEPLHGGMREEGQKGGRGGPGSAEKDPPAPYHGARVPDAGAAPRGEPGGGTPREGTPPEPGEAGESAAHPDYKIEQERRDYEHEGAPPPR